MKVHHWGFVLLALFVALAFGQDYIIWTGGVGEREREDAPTDSTRLVFYQEDGSYLSSVDIQVRTREGTEVVNTRTWSPWLILDLPSGEYVLEARRANRETVSASFEVGNEKNKELALAFPEFQ